MIGGTGGNGVKPPDCPAAHAAALTPRPPTCTSDGAGEPSENTLADGGVWTPALK